MKKKDILRRSRFSEEPEEAVSNFVSSIGQDRKILEADIWVDKAHVLMLHHQGIISKSDALAILDELDSISSLDWNDLLDGSYDDVHVLLESRIIKSTGEDVGGRLHTGRSRNDEVVTCIRIALREDILDIIEALVGLQDTILDIASKHRNTMMPGYTHLQRGQSTTLAHHILAHCESIGRDMDRLKSCYDRVNVSSLGAGAMCSTSHPIDPNYSADLLAFDGVAANSMDAVASRDFLLEAVSTLSVAGVGLSRIAEELVIWSTTEFGFITLSDAYSFTSSIMPQKRNPDVAELSRARTSTITGGLMSALSICRGLPLSYNSDLQEATYHLWNATDTFKAIVPVLKGALATMSVNEGAMKEATKRGFLWATDLADLLVSEHGLPFRAAHSIVAEVAKNWKCKRDSSQIAQDIVEASKKLGRPLEIDVESVSRAMDSNNSIRRRIACGGPSPVSTGKYIRASRRTIERTLSWIGKKRDCIQAAKYKVGALGEELAS